MCNRRGRLGLPEAPVLGVSWVAITWKLGWIWLNYVEFIFFNMVSLDFIGFPMSFSLSLFLFINTMGPPQEVKSGHLLDSTPWVFRSSRAPWDPHKVYLTVHHARVHARRPSFVFFLHMILHGIRATYLTLFDTCTCNYPPYTVIYIHNTVHVDYISIILIILVHLHDFAWAPCSAPVGRRSRSTGDFQPHGYRDWKTEATSIRTSNRWD